VSFLSRPAWSAKAKAKLIDRALTIHKAQGQTLDKVKVDVRKCFSPGEPFPALSCVLVGAMKLSSRSSLYCCVPGDFKRGSTAFEFHPEKVSVSLLTFERS